MVKEEYVQCYQWIESPENTWLRTLLWERFCALSVKPS